MLTPAATAADLLDELRQLLGRHDGASTLDEIREFADELSTVLRRTRGRITRLARQTEPEAPAVPPDRAQAERPAPPPASPPRPTFAAPLPPPRPVVIEIRPDKPASDPAPTVRPVEPPPATPRRRGGMAVARLLLAVLAALWAAVRPAVTPARRLAHAVRRTVRRRLAAARPYARRVRAAGRRELDRWLS